jgi:hypothetical protein
LNQWVKRAELGTRQVLFSAGTGANAGHEIEFQSDNTLAIYSNAPGASVALATTQVFRDPSAYGMLTIAFDTTQATDTNRIKVYWNGIQITAFSSASYPAQNADLEFNNNVPHNIGRREISTTFYCGLYMTEINFVDGQALTPSSFGLNDPETGIWSPKRYTGTYGTNGFYLNFSDNSGTTSTTLGKDSSGNGNNWTPNNFSVTAGSGNDSMVDSPTAYGTDTGVGGSVRGNYCTLNPLASGTNTTLANGALDFSCGSFQFSTSVATLGLRNGKWYWEVTANSNGIAVGIMSSNANLAPSALNLAGPGESVNGWHYQFNANRITNNTAVSYGATFSTSDVIGVALDLDAGTIVFYKNGTSQGTAYSGLSTSLTYFPAVGDATSGVAASCSCNFGQRAFAYTAPSGFKALCTQNLPTPTIGATSTTLANKYFNPVLYTGTGSSLSVTGVGFQPDWVWIKERNAAADHGLYDAVRGVQKQLESNTTTAETTETTGLTAFGSDGFTVGALAQLNTSADTYVAWNWNAGGSNATNTSGTITSTVRANTTSGFSIVTYTGNGSANQTVGHGLGVAPAFGILKDRDTNSNNNQWQVFHTAAGDQYGYLSTTAAFAGTAEFYPTSGSSTTVTVGRGSPAATTNESGDNFVMYLFTPVAGYSAFGSYTANNSTDGVFVYLGFRPEFLMIKRSSSSGNSWGMFDTTRSTYNATANNVWANQSYAENSTVIPNIIPIDILSNGFN